MPAAYVKVMTARRHASTDTLLRFSQPRLSGASRRGRRTLQEAIVQVLKDVPVPLCHCIGQLSQPVFSSAHCPKLHGCVRENLTQSLLAAATMSWITRRRNTLPINIINTNNCANRLSASRAQLPQLVLSSFSY